MVWYKQRPSYRPSCLVQIATAAPPLHTHPATSISPISASLVSWSCGWSRLKTYSRAEALLSPRKLRYVFGLLRPHDQDADEDEDGEMEVDA